MRLTRVHVAVPLQVGATIALPAAQANHLARVLRLGEGADCVLFNGDGHDYAARLTAVERRAVSVEILARHALDNESPLRITLLQGIARGDRMDLVLQKATELGVHAIVPVNAQRSDVKLDGERLARRMAHWHAVVVAACEQSGRATIPGIAAIGDLRDAAGALAVGGLHLLLDPDGQHTVASLRMGDAMQVTVAIGPEGGWSPRDRALLFDAGCIGLRLGPRILRTETAGLAAIAALQARFGDL